MHFAGVLPEDAPDPRLEREDLLKDMPIPVMEFADQRSVEVTDIGVSTGADGVGFYTMTASVSGTLWREPEDKTNPVNLAELNEETRHSLEEVPPWPRPAWLIEQVQRMRYPHLWEVIRTTWHREESELSRLDRLLVQHVQHILMNQFREELGLGLHD